MVHDEVGSTDQRNQVCSKRAGQADRWLWGRVGVRAVDVPERGASIVWKRSWAIASIIAALIVGASVYIYTSSRPIDNGQPVANASCRQEKSNGLDLRALQDGSGVPLNGVEVKASPATLCNAVETVIAILLRATTNSSGPLHFGGFYGDYYKVTVLYSGRTYNYTAPIKANQTTLLTLHFPSGSSEINFQ